MIALPFFALLAAILVISPFGFLLWFATKPGMFRVLGFVSLVILSFPTFGFFFGLFQQSTTKHGFDVAPDEVPAFAMPRTATEIDYCFRIGPTRLVVQFAITENDFLEWMEHNNRSAVAINEPEQVFALNSNKPGKFDELLIESGLCWDDYDRNEVHDDSGTTIVFDSNSNRAYVIVSAW